MTPPRVRGLIGTTFLLASVALVPTFLHSISILPSEVSPLGIGVWLALAAAYTFWQWKFTEATIALIPYARKAVSKLIVRMRE